LFVAANLSSGVRPALAAGFAELLFRFVTSGFYGALTQSFRFVSPAWAGALAVAVLLPLVSHILEWLLHWLRGTPHLRASIIASVCVTAISTGFNWYAMRRGVFIVGEGRSSLLADLLRLPKLLLEIGGSIRHWMLRCARGQGRPGASGCL
jgi:hypothetical protein